MKIKIDPSLPPQSREDVYATSRFKRIAAIVAEIAVEAAERRKGDAA